GQRYWLAFASKHELGKYRQSVIDYWEEGSQQVAALMEEAIRNDRYRWHPQYDPVTGLTYGYVIDDAKEKQWRIRVEKRGTILWEKRISGTKSHGYFSWVLDANAVVNYPEKVPSSGKVLVAETMVEFNSGNEYALPEGPYQVRTAF